MSFYYYNLLKFLRGYKKVFLPKDLSGPPEIENTDYIMAPFKKGMEKNIFFTLLWGFQIFYHLIFDKPDFLHIGKIRPVVYFFLIFKIFKPRIILYFHGLDYYELKNKSFIKRKFVNYAIKKCDLLVCANKYILEVIRKNVNFKRSYLLYPGVDIDYLKNMEKKFDVKKERDFVLLTVANLVKRKNIDTVLKALNLIKNDFDFNYYIIGKGPEEENLKRLSCELGLDERVLFLGELEEEKFKYYKICDIFVMPSKIVEEEGSVEGFGIVFLEAGFFKKFLIGAKTGGIPEAVKDGESGILIENPEDYKKLADIIKEYFKNPEKFDFMRENAYRRVKEKFDVRNLIKEYEKILASLKK